MAAPKPIPDSPTHCRSCGAELPPLRRYAGLCASCLPAQQQPPLADPTERQWQVLRRFRKPRRDGRGSERCVRVRCSCGSERTMTEAIWRDFRSTRCRACRLRAYRRGGFNGY
jgi:NMD protein affecting ribosome stability and mRNA decay